MRVLFWRACLAFVVFGFVTRFVAADLCGVDDWKGSLLTFILCLLVLYVSFLVEGIVLAVSKIEDYDDEATIRTFRSLFGVSDLVGTSLVKLKHKSDGIFMGQPLVAIVVAFAFNGLLGRAGVSPGAACPGIPAHLHFLLPLYSDGLASIVVSTMLIYWVSQVLPQSIGKSSASGFMRFRGAIFVADTLALATPVGVGEPGLMLERWVRWAGMRTDSPALPLGDGSFLDAMSADYGRRVVSRLIRIAPADGAMHVIDEARHSYPSARHEVDHIYTVARDQFDEDAGVTIRVGFPEGVVREPASPTKLFRFTLDGDIVSAGMTNNVAQGDVPDPPDGEPLADQADSVGVEPSLLSAEIAFVVRSSSDGPVSWTTLQASYNLDPTSVDVSADGTTELYFPLALPTETINIQVTPPDRCFVHGLDLSFTSDGSRIFDRFSPVQRGTLSQTRDGPTWILTHKYPPLAAEIRLRIDFRQADSSLG